MSTELLRPPPIFSGNPSSCATLSGVVGAKKSQGMARDMWDLWRQITRRPAAHKKCPDDVAAALETCCEMDEYTAEKASFVVLAASTLIPHPDDTLDTGRLVDACENPDTIVQVVSDATSVRPLICFPGVGVPARTLRSFATSIGLSYVPKSDDNKKALWTLYHHGVQTCLPIVESLDGGDDGLVDPIEVVRAIYDDSSSRIRETRYEDLWVSTPPSRTSARSGVVIDDVGCDYSAPGVVSVRKELLSYDLLSLRLKDEGATHRDVLSLHHMAPEGFWEAVKDVMDSSHTPLTLKEAYARLEADFGGFNPLSDPELKSKFLSIVSRREP